MNQWMMAILVMATVAISSCATQTEPTTATLIKKLGPIEGWEHYEEEYVLERICQQMEIGPSTVGRVQEFSMPDRLTEIKIFIEKFEERPVSEMIVSKKTYTLVTEKQTDLMALYYRYSGTTGLVRYRERALCVSCTETYESNVKDGILEFDRRIRHKIKVMDGGYCKYPVITERKLSI